MRDTLAIAYLWAYNEVDVIAHVVRHLFNQGVVVHAFDNGSIDGTYETLADLARLRGGDAVDLVVERRPSDGYASLGDMLRTTEKTAASLGHAHWAIHHDADEVLRSKKPGESVAEMLARVAANSYNAVESDVETYAPDERYTAGADPEATLTRHIPDHVDARTRHVRCWLQQPGVRVNLATRGGHFVTFPKVRRSPEHLLMKHYPLRNAEQAARKVAARRARWSPTERARGWHSHYDEWTP